MTDQKHAFVVVPLVIGTLTGVFAMFGVLVQRALGISNRLHMPTTVRAAGVGALALGFAFMGWIFRYRSPARIIRSTYETIRNARRPSLAERTPPRTEPLVLRGPHRHVRHPLYFAIPTLFLGWWLLLDYTVLLMIAILFLLWFRMVVIRFEERELRALFGTQYEVYIGAVPMLLSCPPADARHH